MPDWLWLAVFAMAVYAIYAFGKWFIESDLFDTLLDGCLIKFLTFLFGCIVLAIAAALLFGVFVVVSSFING